MQLYTYFRSSAAYRVRIALNLKGLQTEHRFVHLPRGEHRGAEYAKVNAQTLLPSLVLDDGQVLTQSLAILEYLEETHPEPPLLPRDAVGRARVRSLAQLIACEIHPLNNLRTLNHLRKPLGLDENAVKAWYRHWIADGLAKFEADLAAAGASEPFCFGSAPTLADCCLAPQIFNARRFECDLSPYPATLRAYEACMRLDAFRRAEPGAQPDAE